VTQLPAARLRPAHQLPALVPVLDNTALPAELAQEAAAQPAELAQEAAAQPAARRPFAALLLPSLPSVLPSRRH